MKDEVIDTFGVTAERLTELVEKELKFRGVKNYLHVLKRQGYEFEDVVQTILGQLIVRQDGFDPEKGSLSTYVRINTMRKLQHMIRDANADKRLAQMHTVAVAQQDETESELIHVFGSSPDHAEEIRQEHIERILYEQYPSELVDIFLESTVEGYTIKECVERHPYNYNKLQRTFMKMRRTLQESLFSET